jgi:hypothetical protein
MANYKVLTYLFGTFFVILLLLVIFSGKKTVYVCYDGTEQQDIKKCPVVPPLYITQKQADAAVTTYANAYALPKSDRIFVVNIYRTNSSWKSTVAFSGIKSNTTHEILFNIDGKTSTVTCLEGCEYLGILNSTN